MLPVPSKNEYINNSTLPIVDLNNPDIDKIELDAANSLIEPMKNRLFNIMGKKIKQNLSNIVVKAGQQRIGLSQRLPGFFKTEIGTLWCTNVSQDQALIRQNQSEVPIAIHDKRGSLERLCDLWSTGPSYLKRAAQEIDLIERFKNVIAFAISGLHASVS